MLSVAKSPRRRLVHLLRAQRPSPGLGQLGHHGRADGRKPSLPEEALTGCHFFRTGRPEDVLYPRTTRTGPTGSLWVVGILPPNPKECAADALPSACLVAFNSFPPRAADP